MHRPSIHPSIPRIHPCIRRSAGSPRTPCMREGQTEGVGDHIETNARPALFAFASNIRMALSSHTVRGGLLRSLHRPPLRCQLTRCWRLCHVLCQRETDTIVDGGAGGREGGAAGGVEGTHGALLAFASNILSDRREREFTTTQTQRRTGTATLVSYDTSRLIHMTLRSVP